MDNEGKTRVPEGQSARRDDLLGATDYLVAGATGKIK